MQEMRWGCAAPVNPPVPSRLSWVVRWISYRCSARSTRVVAQAPEVRLWFGWGETGARHTEGGCDLCKVWVAHKPDGARSQAADAQRLKEGRVARVGKHHGHRPVGDQHRARFKHPFSIHPSILCRLRTRTLPPCGADSLPCSSCPVSCLNSATVARVWRRFAPDRHARGGGGALDLCAPVHPCLFCLNARRVEYFAVCTYTGGTVHKIRSWRNPRLL